MIFELRLRAPTINFPKTKLEYLFGKRGWVKLHFVMCAAARIAKKVGGLEKTADLAESLFPFASVSGTRRFVAGKIAAVVTLFTKKTR